MKEIEKPGDCLNYPTPYRNYDILERADCVF